MDLTVQELTVLVDADLNHGCITGNTRQTDIIRGAEVSQTIGDEATFIHLDTSYHMGTVTIDDIGAVVDTEMGQLTQGATVLSEEGLTALRQMALGTTLSTTMEGDDDEVAAFHEVVDDTTYGRQVGMLQGIAVMTEGAEADFQSFALDDGALGTTGDAREQNALFLQHPLCRLDTLLSEVVGVVIGHTHIVEACLLQQMTIAGWRAK